MNKQYENFYKRIGEASNEINAKKVLHSDRHGIAKFRDFFVTFKMAWLESQSWIALIFYMVGLTAWIPDAIDNINAVTKNVGIVFPVDTTSYFIAFVIVAFIGFGLLSYYFGAPKRQLEVASKNSPAQYLLYQRFDEVKAEIAELREQLKNCTKEKEDTQL